MVAVSEIPYLAISLNQNIDCNVMCGKIGKMLEKLRQYDPEISEYVMTIKFSKSVVYDVAKEPLRLESNNGRE